MITVRDFIELNIEPSFQLVDIWSSKENMTIFTGTVEELLEDYDNDIFLDMEIGSFDVIEDGSDRLTLNVD